MSNSIIHLTDETFNEKVLDSNIPVLVDYWAEWCGPCKMIAPILESLVEEYVGKLVIAKHNIDDNPQTPAKYGVRGIPTLMIFKMVTLRRLKSGLYQNHSLLLSSIVRYK